MKFKSLLGTLAIVCACLVLSPGAVRGAGDAWLPLDPSDLSNESPVVDKDADAEAIFWDVRVEDKINQSMARSVLKHYVRIKIYTERGKESQSQIDIPYLKGTRITDIAARTIKPDGSIVEVANNTIFDRTVVKAGDLKVNTKSFAMPAVEPGCIIEYRWTESNSDQIAQYVRLDFQREIPVRKVTYHIKPLAIPGLDLSMRSQTFHGTAPDFVKEKGGFYSVELRNVKAFREEPNMPPEKQVRHWMLLYYTDETEVNPDRYWALVGQGLYKRGKDWMKVNNDVKKAAAEITAGASSPAEKVEKLFEFCRTQIKNLSDDALEMTDEEREKIKENKNPSDTLKRREGSRYEINFLFGALANAAGFDARLAALSNRGEIFFDPSFADAYFLDEIDVAVQVDGDWRVYDPGSTYVPHGMLHWTEEGVQALVGDSKHPFFVKTPVSSPDRSKQVCTGTFRLSEDGTLEGEVRVEFHGHLANARKELNDDETPEQREKFIVDGVKERLAGAEISDVKVENVTDHHAPFIYSYHVRIPGYAQRTGKRLFLQPSFFRKGIAPTYTASERAHAVYFHYPWSEEDTVTVEIPAGYDLDNADSPGNFSVGGTGGYSANLLVGKDGTTLKYERKFFFGGEGSILFPASSYSQLKRVFDTMHQQDGHTVTLKKQEASDAAAQ